MGTYQDTSNSLGSNNTSMSSAITNIKGVSFDGVWSGESHTALTSSLNGVVEKADTSLSQLETFKETLALLDQYKANKEKIADLTAQRNAIVVPAPTKYNSNSAAIAAAEHRRAQLAKEISELEAKNKELRASIESLLSTITEINNELELILFDLNDHKDYAKFLLDIRDLLESYYKGRDEELLAKLATNPALATIYNELDDMTLEEIEAYLRGIDIDCDLLYLLPKNNSDIAHRGYTPGGIYDNSAEGFILAGEKGFWGCEADIRFDAEGNLVCSHDTVDGDENPTSFEEYLDICKEYGMTAIIDLKYEVGNDEKFYSLSPAVLKVIEEKGMMDSCILQTNMSKDLANIRENSKDARIWYLNDSVSDQTIQLIKENNVECLNLKCSGNSTEQIKKLEKLTDGNVDVCVWNVNTQATKDRLLDKGATYIMSDNVLGITPYQEGEQDFNSTKGSYGTSNNTNRLETLEDILSNLNQNNNQVNTPTQNTEIPTNNPNTTSKYDGPILCANPDNPAHSGRLEYTRTDGVTVQESWCDISLKNAPELAAFYKFDGEKVVEGQKIKDMEYWVRDDGVQMIGPYVAVATDVIPRSAYGIDDDMAGWDGKTYNYGDVVETTLGKGIVMGVCTYAVNYREQHGDLYTNLEIYTLWNTPGISGKVWSDDYEPPNYANDPLLENSK